MSDVKPPAARSYGGQSGDQRVSDRRRALLDAAFALVAEAGWRALRIDALCRSAGLNKRYFYESFGNLDAVVVALTEMLAEEAIAAATAELDERTPPAEAPLRAIPAFIHHLTDDPRRARVLFGAIPAGDAAAGHRQAAIRRVVVAAATTGLGIHHLPDAPAVRIAASMLVGGTSQAILDWLDGEIGADQEELITIVVSLWQVVSDETARQVGAAVTEGIGNPPRG